MRRHRIAALAASVAGLIGLLLIPSSGGASHKPSHDPPGQSDKTERPCDPKPDKGNDKKPPCASP